MAQEQMIQVIRPRSNWFVESWRHYGPILWRLLPMLLIVYVPMEILGTIIEQLVGTTGSTSRDIMMSVRLANALESLIGIIAVVGVCLAVRDRREGRMETWGHYLKRGCALWGRALGICLWVGLIVGGLTLLFIVPGVIASVCLALAVQAAILLDLSPKQALSESRRMVKGHWWSTLGVLTLGGVVTALAGLAVALPTGLLSGVMEGLAEEIGGVSPLFKSLELLLNVVGTTLVDIVGVFWTICMTVWFFRLREGMKPAQEAV